MVIGFVAEKLQQKLWRKRQEVIRLRWQKAEMEKALETMKKAAGERQQKTD